MGLCHDCAKYYSRYSTVGEEVTGNMGMHIVLKGGHIGTRHNMGTQTQFRANERFYRRSHSVTTGTMALQVVT